MPTSPNRTADFDSIVKPDGLASTISTMWDGWKSSRAKWENEKQETRNYVFATDTTTTSNSSLPWKNTTTRPKLCQIRDNLHANYMAALFPHEDWFTWEAGGNDGVDKEKAELITAYMKNKLRQSKFKETASQFVYDYIDYGNVFGEVVYINETAEDTEGGLDIIKYQGPKAVRTSPLDIVMNIKAQTFHDSPNITRSVMSIGEFAKMRKDVAGQDKWIDEAFGKAFDIRANVNGSGSEYEEPLKKQAARADGFGDMYEYYTSQQVEILEFNGDLYDIDKGELFEGHRVIVVDRSYVAYNGPYESWLGRQNKEHVGWRQRPDNLMAMGPLDNLVGMQYRIDHLENLRADVFDQIANPVVYQQGEVEDWDFGPGERIYGDRESMVSFLRPDSTALNADMQIQELERTMEDMAGAPRQAMGIRTPGEKTAFEVQTLENNTGRTFQHKTAYFDENFLEPMLNQMLAAARKHHNEADLVRTVDPDFGAVTFNAVTKEDLQAKGKLIPRGSHNYARKAQILQNLTTLGNTAMMQDPAVNVHISGLRIAKALVELTNLDDFNLVEENIRIVEAAETQKTQAAAEEEVASTASVDPSGLDLMADGQLDGGVEELAPVAPLQ